VQSYFDTPTNLLKKAIETYNFQQEHQQSLAALLKKKVTEQKEVIKNLRNQIERLERCCVYVSSFQQHTISLSSLYICRKNQELQTAHDRNSGFSVAPTARNSHPTFSTYDGNIMNSPQRITLPRNYGQTPILAQSPARPRLLTNETPVPQTPGRPTTPLTRLNIASSSSQRQPPATTRSELQSLLAKRTIPQTPTLSKLARVEGNSGRIPPTSGLPSRTVSRDTSKFPVASPSGLRKPTNSSNIPKAADGSGEEEVYERTKQAEVRRTGYSNISASTSRLNWLG
jgi:hypothetical protein